MTTVEPALISRQTGIRVSFSTGSDTLYCRTCLDAKAAWFQRVQGCPAHEPIYDVDRRTKAIWSMVQLINMALLTDPLVWIKLYIVGCPLFLYRVHSLSKNHADGSELFLLPCRILQLTQNIQLDNTQTGDVNVDRYDLVDTVDSTLVPWTALLYCG